MAKRSKIIIALTGLIAGIVIGVLWVSFNQQDFISEDEARAVVTERYGGSVESVSLSDDDRYFVINLKGNAATHSITVDREDSSVQGIKTVAEHTEAEKPAEEQEPAADKGKKEQQTDKESEAEKDTETAKPEENTKLTVEEAVEIAAGEVGGTNVYSTWSGEGSAREYYILQLVNDDDEGALIAINGITGNINKVIWLEIDDDYEEIEQLVYEAAEYANMYDSRYIEYDDEYFED